MKVFPDNATVVYSINNMGSEDFYHMSQRWEKLGVCVVMRINFIMSVHILGMSRSSEKRPGWKLNELYFHSVPSHFRSSPSVDLFASRINTQIPRLFPYQLNPNAEVSNAFIINWHTIDFYYFPTFLVLEKQMEI